MEKNDLRQIVEGLNKQNSDANDLLHCMTLAILDVRDELRKLNEKLERKY